MHTEIRRLLDRLHYNSGQCSFCRSLPPFPAHRTTCLVGQLEAALLAASPAPAQDERLHHLRVAVMVLISDPYQTWDKARPRLIEALSKACSSSPAVSSAPEEVHPGLFAAQRSNSIFSPAVAQDERRQQEEAGPIPLTRAQIEAVETWATDDRLWGSRDATKHNLFTFARTILKLASAGVPVVAPDADPGIHVE